MLEYRRMQVAGKDYFSEGCWEGVVVLVSEAGLE